MTIDLRPWRKSSEVFLAWFESREETEDDAREVRAFDAEEAAEDLAEHDDARGCDYTIVAGAIETVRVKRIDGADVQRFVVSGETVPQYNARRIEVSP